MRRVLVALSLAAAACRGTPTAVVQLPYVQDFSAAELGPEWSTTSGRWRILDGRLFNDGAHNVPLWLAAALPDDVRIGFEAESKSPEVDMKFEVFGNGRDHESGYVVIVAGWNNTTSEIARLDEHGSKRTPAEDVALRAAVARDAQAAAREHAGRREVTARRVQMQPNRVYRFRFERRGHLLQLFIDDELHVELFDPSPLRGEGHDRFAFSNWASIVYFDDLRIEAL